MVAAALPTGRGFLRQLGVISRPGQLAFSTAALMGPKRPAHTALPNNKSTKPLAIPRNHHQPPHHQTKHSQWMQSCLWPLTKQQAPSHKD